MSKNFKKIILVLSLTYFLSIALIFSGIALAGGISCIKLIMIWVSFAFGIFILRSKVSPMYIPLFTLFRKKEVSP
jgi:hypothetical protein